MTHPVCSGGVGALLLSPDGGGACLVGGRDGSLSTFNAAGGAWRELRPFAKVPGCVTSLSLSADGGAFLVGTAQGGVYRCAGGRGGQGRGGEGRVGVGV